MPAYERLPTRDNEKYEKAALVVQGGESGPEASGGSGPCRRATRMTTATPTVISRIQPDNRMISVMPMRPALGVDRSRLLFLFIMSISAPFGPLSPVFFATLLAFSLNASFQVPPSG